MSAAFTNAQRFSRLYAARACAPVWVESQHDFDEFFAHRAWLALALRKLLIPADEAADLRWYEHLAERLFELDARGITYAFEPIFMKVVNDDNTTQ